jgi:GT2 family glycosyltransferase
VSHDRAPRGYLRRMFADLPRRIRLTFEYEGLGGFMRKSGRFLLRLTPLRRFLTEDSATRHAHSQARSWYRNYGRPVTVIIPTYGDPAPAIDAVESVRKTTRRRRVRILVVDDGSAEEARRRLTVALRGKAELELGESNVGYARNCNRALARLARDGEGDIVILNSDVVAHKRWLECLQFAAYRVPRAGIVGAKLLYPDNTIQFAGSYRNLGAPDWFDHRFRFKPADFGPANVPGPVLGVTGACMYVKREALEDLGPFDEQFGMAFEDMDLCLRAWERGQHVLYQPFATLSHLESKTRGTVQGDRELASKEYFWAKWGDWFDRRPVSAGPGRLRIVYVTQDIGIGGGHRVVFEHLNRLAERGHDAALYTLGDGPPAWFDLRVPVRAFEDYEDLVDDLAEVDAIKVATWWETAVPVWLASARRGTPVYFVQDIETSYYPDDALARGGVLSSYRPEFRYLTTSPWNQEQLAGLGYEPTIVSPGVDRSTYRPLGIEREPAALLAVGRSHQLKNLDLTVEAWRLLPEPRPELWLFGIEPELGERYGARYFEDPDDARVNELLNRATAFVQTSRHEGFCLPLLEAMSAGTATVCTDAHGNRGFCVPDVNCQMAESSAGAVAEKLSGVLSDASLRERLAGEGLRTAEGLDWTGIGDELERFFLRVAGERAGAEEARTTDEAWSRARSG